MKKNLNIRILDGHSTTGGGNDRIRKSFTRIAITALRLVLGLWLLTACYKLVGPAQVGMVVEQSGARPRLNKRSDRKLAQLNWPNTPRAKSSRPLRRLPEPSKLRAVPGAGE